MTLHHRNQSLQVEKRRALQQLRSKDQLLEKYIFMAQLRTRNVALFYKLVMEHLRELAPVIYTPTVGTACLEYSNILPYLAEPGVPDGLFLNKADLPNLHQVIRDYQPFPNFSPQIAVISDGSRILGLGDLGLNGMGIPIGKLQLYVAGAGIDPRRTLPILLDLGTNNEALRNDEFYLGQREPRPNDNEFYSTVDTVLKALKDIYPDMLIQFEDWSSEHAFGLLEKYQHKILCFNDDIQGTGAVILSGVMNAIRRVQSESGVNPCDHRIVFYGAGSAAIGVARQIQEYFMIDQHMSEDQARSLFWIVDSKGLVTLDRGDKLANHKVYYARKDNQGKQVKGLLNVVDYVKPTILIGLSSVSGAFDTKVLQRMAKLNKQPIVFPLSNPATKAECTFEQAMQATDNRVIFASGTAFPAYTLPNNKTIHPDQGNNMYIFPGLGMGAALAHPATITDRMIYVAAKALADSLTPQEQQEGYLYPALDRIRQVSAQVAAAVMIEADSSKYKSKDAVSHYVQSQMWNPDKEDPAIISKI
ncbi:hypothetical protein K492DRAFT_150701 [Lichtheimia hyalospora FSU 10163]|nr:hypothetical protein K492DRAFT_150701 [Lichtheimia hyalospora FSU 10163]